MFLIKKTRRSINPNKQLSKIGIFQRDLKLQHFFNKVKDQGKIHEIS